ncbi:hypothetical protein OUZ56_022171 [Daphnia magna]|uniref:Uncharacterized protein n=1 Tax=Daphnia magna TaxID=35525 RepID=A0ABR0AVJ7_9CRUS|nr:hypothetical protein OUZ56_022171 [Daphnia magna]
MEMPIEFNWCSTSVTLPEALYPRGPNYEKKNSPRTLTRLHLSFLKTKKSLLQKSPSSLVENQNNKKRNLGELLPVLAKRNETSKNANEKGGRGTSQQQTEIEAGIKWETKEKENNNVTAMFPWGGMSKFAERRRGPQNEAHMRAPRKVVMLSVWLVIESKLDPAHTSEFA